VLIIFTDIPIAATSAVKIPKARAWGQCVEIRLAEHLGLPFVFGGALLAVGVFLVRVESYLPTADMVGIRR
jgi:hypothetical protein